MTERKKRGYARKLMARIQAADDTKLGVKLGKLCIQLAVPISDVAGFFNVSKPTVYTWFTGKNEPRTAELKEKLERVISKLEAKVEQSAAPVQAQDTEEHEEATV